MVGEVGRLAGWEVGRLGGLKAGDGPRGWSGGDSAASLFLSSAVGLSLPSRTGTWKKPPIATGIRRDVIIHGPNPPITTPYAVAFFHLPVHPELPYRTVLYKYRQYSVL
jgi:hypothetical protein